eukprot:symbB.v1.2.000319.t1/scaffold6.1/size569917/22
MDENESKSNQDAEKPEAAEPGPEDQGSTRTSSSAPRNEYLTFKEMLKHESALPLVAKLQDFVRQFPRGGLSRDQAANRIHKFISSTQDWMLSKVLVFADADEAGQTSAVEGLEKFLMTRLIRVHGEIFWTENGDLDEDELLKQRIDSLSWVGFQNLGVPSVDVTLLDLAVDQLRSMDNFKAPRDKMICILNACRVINDVLKRSIVESGVGRPLAADDFLPLLIYCLILANPPRLHSNMEFVAAFRHPSRLIAEDAYFLTALQSAAAFVKDAGPKVLDVSEEEFQKLCAESFASKGYVTNGTKPGEAITAAEKGLELSADVRKILAERIRALPLRFEGTQSVRNLRVGDLPLLLEEYREMACILKKVQSDTLMDDG